MSIGSDERDKLEYEALCAGIILNKKKDKARQHLEDLKKELWLRQRENGKLAHHTKDGQSIPIKDMDDTHLMNTIKSIEKFCRKEYQ